ncbi:MAG: hypothetical protein WCH46_03910 [bacterium]
MNVITKARSVAILKVGSFAFFCSFLLLPRTIIAQDSTSTHKDTTITPAVSTTPDEAPPPSLWHFGFSPSIGFTFQGISKDGEESEDLQWLSSLQAKAGYEGSRFQFNSNLFLQYGAQVSREAPPKKVQDNFQLSLIPSVTISDRAKLRLIFEVTGETEMGEGLIDSVPTRFLDPLFLYEALFIGHKSMLTSENGNSQFEFVFGVGYAYQQTLANKFILEQNRKFVDNSGLLSDVQDQFTVEKGYSSVLQINWNVKLAEDLSFKESFKSVAMTKDDFTKNIKNSRIGSLLLASIAYKIFSIDYTLHIIYDKNLSPRRQLDQTMVFGLKFDL